MVNMYDNKNFSKESEKYAKRHIKIMTRKQRINEMREESPLEAFLLNTLTNIQIGYYYFVGKF